MKHKCKVCGKLTTGREPYNEKGTVYPRKHKNGKVDCEGYTVPIIGGKKFIAPLEKKVLKEIVVSYDTLEMWVKADVYPVDEYARALSTANKYAISAGMKKSTDIAKYVNDNMSIVWYKCPDESKHKFRVEIVS